MTSSFGGGTTTTATTTTMSSTTDEFDREFTPEFFLSQLLQDTILGLCVGSFSKTITAPLSRIQQLLQCQEADKTSPHFDSVSDALSYVKEHQGRASLWRTNNARMFRGAFHHALLLMFHGAVHGSMPRKLQDSKRSSLASKSIAAGIAGALTSLIFFPLDFAITRLATDADTPSKYSGVIDVLQKARVSEISAGLKWSVLSAFIFHTSHVAFFKKLQQRRNEHPYYAQHHKTSPWVRAAGAFGVVSLSRALALVLSYPFLTMHRHSIVRGETVNDTGAVGNVYSGFLAEVLRGALSTAVVMAYDHFSAKWRESVLPLSTPKSPTKKPASPRRTRSAEPVERDDNPTDVAAGGGVGVPPIGNFHQVISAARNDDDDDDDGQQQQQRSPRKTPRSPRKKQKRVQ